MKVLCLVLFVCLFTSYSKERLSILDFARVGAAEKMVSAEEMEDLTQQVRGQASRLLSGRFEIMTREAILVMIPPGSSLEECEGQCEVETARNLGSRWHVVGDVKKVGSSLVLSIRLFDVQSGGLVGDERLKAGNVDGLADSAASRAGALFAVLKTQKQAAPERIDLDAQAPPFRKNIQESGVNSGQSRPGLPGAARSGMVRIPAGCFEMGARSCGLFKGEGQQDECPRRQVCLSGFWMDSTEVTQEAYRQVLGSNPSTFASCGGDCPVEQVTWGEAKTYCERIGKRLPTEAQWEYAARAGTVSRWAWGELDSSAGEFAWFEANSSGRTHPVGSKRANPWGLYDMAGNVWEWTSDWYGTYQPVHKPDPAGPAFGTHRVGRGGGWNGKASGIRPSYRSADPADFRAGYLGFRCVLNES